MGKAQGIKTSIGYLLPPNFRKQLARFGKVYLDLG
jgi:hypothetical protein